jgi:hypothetical protein
MINNIQCASEITDIFRVEKSQQSHKLSYNPCQGNHRKCKTVKKYVYIVYGILTKAPTQTIN